MAALDTGVWVRLTTENDIHAKNILDKSGLSNNPYTLGFMLNRYIKAAPRDQIRVRVITFNEHVKNEPDYNAETKLETIQMSEEFRSRSAVLELIANKEDAQKLLIPLLPFMIAIKNARVAEHAQMLLQQTLQRERDMVAHEARLALQRSCLHPVGQMRCWAESGREECGVCGFMTKAHFTDEDVAFFKC